MEEKSKKILKKSGEPLVFVVHEHHARRLHWDLRLEIDGILKSWAVPKDPAEVSAAVKRLAIETEDHPYAYKDFEGELPEGTYGAGKVIIYDSGPYELLKRTPNKIEFFLKGKKLKGKYVLVKFEKAGPKNWLLMKGKE